MSSPTDFVVGFLSKHPDSCPGCGNARINAMILPCGHSLCGNCMAPTVRQNLSGTVACSVCNLVATIVMPASDIRGEVGSVIFGQATPDIDFHDESGLYLNVMEYNMSHLGCTKPGFFTRIWQMIIMLVVMVRTSWWYCGIFATLLIAYFVYLFVHNDMILDQYGFIGYLDDIIMFVMSIALIFYFTAWQKQRIATRSVLLSNAIGSRKTVASELPC